MHIVMFYHSLVSDWNHGNAHFIRGIAGELLSRGHRVKVFEPRNSWSRVNLIEQHGEDPLREFKKHYPKLQSEFYDPASLDLDEALDDADLVLVHEWNDHDFVARIGRHRSQSCKYRLLFHDTHHRMVSDARSMAQYDLRHFDGVLAYGQVLRNLYLARNLTGKAWVWHEAADTAVFRPIVCREKKGDLVWIGNWGDGERTLEFQEYLINPVQKLKLKTFVYGVRYPEWVQNSLAQKGIEYAGWLANFAVPEVFSSFSFTIHIPRNPYTKTLPGIPTIRVFEALACGIPLVCSPWEDSEELFTPGMDFLVARNGLEMERHLKALLNDPDVSEELIRNGLQTIRTRHTCAHRVDELLDIYEELTFSDELNLINT